MRIGSQYLLFFFFSSRRRHTRLQGDWSSDVCSSDLPQTTMSVPEITPPEPKQAGGCGTVLLILIGLVLLLPGFCSLIFIGLSMGGSGEIGRASCRERV